MAISFGVFTTMMLFGFRTFGGAAQTLLLNNYHRTDDPLASLARLATGFSILCGFPLMFAALKTSFFNAASEISEKFGDGGMKMARRFQSDEGLRVGKKGRDAGTAGRGERVSPREVEKGTIRCLLAVNDGRSVSIFSTLFFVVVPEVRRSTYIRL